MKIDSNLETDHSQLLQVLTDQFGFNSFHPGQLEAITHLLQHKSLLCIQPTGYGKSLLYQLPAVLLDGITVVISPLLALMRDQIQQLNKRFNIATASINSDQTPEEDHHARQAALAGTLKILFVAPEQLDHIDRFNFLINLPVRLLVIDEAHCISTWGHDFRPSYRQIIHFIQALRTRHSVIHVLGLTATANDKTAADIKQQLSDEHHSVAIHRASMDRPNIQLSVIQVLGLANKLHCIEQLLKTINGCGLIYCATRENTILVAEYLQKQGIEAAAYHAGFHSQDKQKIQQDFLQNTYKVIAATNALGMGIDKSDLRFVIHFDVPSSITAYYQEVGRAGRDGLDAKGILLFDSQDIKIQDYFINSAQPTAEDFAIALKMVKTATKAPGLIEIKRQTGLHPTRVTVVIAELIEQHFLIKVSDKGKQVYKITDKNAPLDLTRYQIQYEIRHKELTAIVDYAQQTKTCLMQLLREALGDAHNIHRCEHCGVCRPQTLNSYSQESIAAIDTWIQQRLTVIEAQKSYRTEAGVSVLDGKLRSPLFIHFMRQRSLTPTNNALPIATELSQLLKKHLAQLKKNYPLSALVVIPSRTWMGREKLAGWIANELAIPVFLDYLYWQEQPAARQGELLNNDQRRFNVDKRMTHVKQQLLPSGALLLLDDYTGSGATLSEAARVLRKEAHYNGLLVPFTIAQIKWRLGKAGMI